MDAGNQVEACAAALDWTAASPNSEAAWQALADSAGADFGALAVSAARRLHVLLGKEPGEEPAPFETPYGPLSLRDLVRMDTCRIMLSMGRLKEAEAQVVGLDHVSARNNLALTKFAQGQIAEALALQEENCRRAPDNLFGQGRLARLRLWTGGMAAASATLDALLASEPRRDEDWEGQLQGLLLLDRIEEAEAAWMRGHQLSAGLPNLPYGEFSQIGAYLAWRLGRVEEARKRLDDGEFDEADRDDFDFALLRCDTPDWRIGEFYAWWPLASTEAMRQSGGQDAELHSLVESLGVHNDYLARMAELAGHVGRGMAMILLKHRANQGDQGAVEALKGLLARPCGPDEVRSQLMAWLSEEDLIVRGAPIKVWLNGELKDISPRSFRVNYDAMTEEDLPEADAVAYERAIGRVHERKLDEAASELEPILERHPNHPRLLANLALVRLGAGRPTTDFEPLAARALEIAPDYSFARVAMAHVLIGQDRLDEAGAMIAPIFEQEALHVTEWRAVLGVQIGLARARKDIPALFDLMASLRDLDGNDSE